MVANAISWPAPLIPSEAMFHPDTPSRSGGLSISGSEQITVAPGRWRAKLNVPLYTEKKVLAFRAFLAQMQGRAGTVLVPKWEHFAPHDVNGRRFAHRDANDDPMNFDLTGFGQSDIAYALTVASASTGGTRLAVEVLSGEGPQPGQYFGLGARLYLCSNVWQDANDRTILEFFPRLRAAVPVGARVILDRPVCLMRLASDNMGELMMDATKVGQTSLEFVEVPPSADEAVEVWTGAVSEDNRWRGLDFSNPDNSQFLPAL
jgi:hypothetical protein